MSKPKPRRIPSDSLTITVGGKDYHPHADEWVEMHCFQTIGDFEIIQGFQKLAERFTAAAEDPVATAALSAEGGRLYADLCETLAFRVKAWNWTDNAGRPLPQPDGTAERLKVLTTEELQWLFMRTAVAEPGAEAGAEAAEDTPAPVTTGRRRK